MRAGDVGMVGSPLFKAWWLCQLAKVQFVEEDFHSADRKTLRPCMKKPSIRVVACAEKNMISDGPRGLNICRREVDLGVVSESESFAEATNSQYSSS